MKGKYVGEETEPRKWSKEEMEEYLTKKAQAAIDAGVQLSKSKKPADKEKGRSLRSAGELVMELFHADEPDFEERAKALFSHVHFNWSDKTKESIEPKEESKDIIVKEIIKNNAGMGIKGLAEKIGCEYSEAISLLSSMVESGELGFDGRNNLVVKN
jgi:predicted transcriptional regulator